MKKNDFMQRLSDELQKRNVADAADILQEYEAHFAMKMADGYIEEEIAARLGDPTALAAQFDDAEETPEKKGGSKPLVVAGLCFADVFAGLFFILLAAWGWCWRRRRWARRARRCACWARWSWADCCRSCPTGAAPCWR